MARRNDGRPKSLPITNRIEEIGHAISATPVRRGGMKWGDKIENGKVVPKENND